VTGFPNSLHSPNFRRAGRLARELSRRAHALRACWISDCKPPGPHSRVKLCWLSVNWSACVPAIEYNAILGEPVWNDIS
jgi:hypothetical protein